MMKDNDYARRIFGSALLLLIATCLIVPAYSAMWPDRDWRIPMVIMYGIVLFVLFAVPHLMHRKIQYLHPDKGLAIFLILFLVAYPLINYVIFDVLKLGGPIFDGSSSWLMGYPHGVVLIVIAYNYYKAVKRSKEPENTSD